MSNTKNFYPDLPEKRGNLDFACKSLARLLKNSKKKQSIIIMYEKNICAIIIFFLRSVYQQVLFFYSQQFSHKRITNWSRYRNWGFCRCDWINLWNCKCYNCFQGEEVSKKVIKHEKTLAICESKVNSIKDRISKAVKDNKISDEEFSSILSEVEKYTELERAIRAKYRRSKETNETHVEDLKKQIRLELMEKLKAGKT